MEKEIVNFIKDDSVRRIVTDINFDGDRIRGRWYDSVKQRKQRLFRTWSSHKGVRIINSMGSAFFMCICIFSAVTARDVSKVIWIILSCFMVAHLLNSILKELRAQRLMRREQRSLKEESVEDYFTRIPDGARLATDLEYAKRDHELQKFEALLGMRGILALTDNNDIISLVCLNNDKSFQAIQFYSGGVNYSDSVRDIMFLFNDDATVSITVGN